MKTDIIITLALLTIGLGIRPWRFRNSEKTRNTIFEILGWISLISGTLMMLAGITGNPSAVGYYYAVLVFSILIFLNLNRLIIWLKTLCKKK